MLTLLVSFCLVFGVLFDYFESQTFDELAETADYVSYAVSNEGTAYIDNFRGSGKRITLVAPDGRVIADTQADAEKLENHSSRKEISDAIKFGSGKSSRYSSTVMQKTLYYAKRLDDGSVLRVSTTQNSVFMILLGLLQPIVAAVMIALVISLVLSHKASESIIKPINSIDLDNPEESEAYEELSPLLGRISEQKRTIERQIKEAEQKQEEFRLITENMSEGLIIIDKDANVLSYNRAAVNLLEVGEIKNASVLAFNRSRGFRSVVDAALSGKRAEDSINHGDSTYELTASPVYDSGKIIGAVIVIIDVTERATREQLRREFTSNVSHELKTPLTSISGFAEMLSAGGTPEATVVDFASSIYSEAQRLISLVSDIMKISELDEGATELEKEPVDLYELSKGVLQRLSPVAKKRNITMSLGGESAVVTGNAKVLDEMIYNLCDNAIKYNKDGGKVDITVTRTEDGKTHLNVSDTGIGIPKNEQSRVFERFYRVDKSHSKLIGGTGLGLAIVKHAAMYHGAEISLESTVGVGTEITVSFPA